MLRCCVRCRRLPCLPSPFFVVLFEFSVFLSLSYYSEFVVSIILIKLLGFIFLKEFLLLWRTAMCGVVNLLMTPLGAIRVFVDDVEVPYVAQAVELTRHCAGVCGRFAIAVAQAGAVRCELSSGLLGEPDSGERFESVRFYAHLVVLSIGVVAEFPEDGAVLASGLVVRGPVTFGVCWAEDACEDDVRTFFGADLSIC